MTEPEDTHTVVLVVIGVRNQQHLDDLVDLVNDTAYVSGIAVSK